jgi:hypothetical protein
MGIAPGSTGAQYQCDTLFINLPPDKVHNAPIEGGLQSSGRSMANASFFATA